MGWILHLVNLHGYSVIFCAYCSMGTRLIFLVYHFLYWSFILLYVWTLYIKFYAPNQSFSNNYLADLICMPIVFYIVVEIFKILKINFRLSLPKIIVGVLYFSFLFEFLLPRFSSRYTGDWYDILMYCIGGGGYYLINKILKPYHYE